VAPEFGVDVPERLGGLADSARREALARIRARPERGGLELVARSVLPWAGGTRVRLAWRLHGLVVEDADVRVHLDREGRVKRVSGAEPPWTEVQDPALVLPEAAHRGQRELSRLLGPDTPEARRGALLWIPVQGGLRLAWRIDYGYGAPGQAWRLWVDASDGAVLRTEPLARHARANVYPENPTTSDLIEVELQGLLDDGALRGEYADVWSCEEWADGGAFGGGGCAALGRHAAPDDAGDYYFDPDPTSSEDPLSEVQMYHHLDHVSRWFRDTLAFEHDEPLRGIVNFDYDNAFYGDADGDGDPDVAFGQARGIDYAYDGDVVFHEFGHSVIGVVAQTIFLGADSYGLEWANGSLNEGSADLFSVAITGDPALGEYAGGSPLGGAIRNLDADRHCPEDLYGEVHRDGEVWGAMGWNMIADPALGPTVTAQIIYGAASDWDADVNWERAGESLDLAITDMEDAGAIDASQAGALRAHAAAAGVIGCGRVAALDGGAEPTLFLVNAGLSGAAERIPLSLQFSLHAPEGAERLRFRVRDLVRTTNELGYTIFVRRGEPVGHVVEELGFLGVRVPVPTDFDWSVDGEDDGFDLILDAGSDPPLEPGATYFFSIASRNLGGIDAFEFATGEITVAGDVRVAEEQGEDPTPEPEQEAGDGCGACDQAAGGPEGLLGAALFLLVLRRQPFKGRWDSRTPAFPGHRGRRRSPRA
jgi:hypothetical protein